MNLLNKYINVSVENISEFSEEEARLALEQLEEQVEEIDNIANDAERLNTAANEIELQDQIKQRLEEEHQGELPESVQVSLQLARRATVAGLGIDPESEEGKEYTEEVTSVPVSNEDNEGKQGLVHKIIEGLKKTFKAIYEKILSGIDWLINLIRKTGHNTTEQLKRSIENLRSKFKTEDELKTKLFETVSKEDSNDTEGKAFIFATSTQKNKYLLPKSIFYRFNGSIEAVNIQHLDVSVNNLYDASFYFIKEGRDFLEHPENDQDSEKTVDYINQLYKNKARRVVYDYTGEEYKISELDFSNLKITPSDEDVIATEDEISDAVYRLYSGDKMSTGIDLLDSSQVIKNLEKQRNMVKAGLRDLTGLNEKEKDNDHVKGLKLYYKYSSNLLNMTFKFNVILNRSIHHRAMLLKKLEKFLNIA